MRINMFSTTYRVADFVKEIYFKINELCISDYTQKISIARKILASPPLQARLDGLSVALGNPFRRLALR